MPISAYYKGHGKEVMASMKDQYGEDKGERVFYATANKKGMNRPGKNKRFTYRKKKQTQGNSEVINVAKKMSTVRQIT